MAAGSRRGARPGRAGQPEGRDDGWQGDRARPRKHPRGDPTDHHAARARRRPLGLGGGVDRHCVRCDGLRRDDHRLQQGHRPRRPAPLSAVLRVRRLPSPATPLPSAPHSPLPTRFAWRQSSTRVLQVHGRHRRVEGALLLRALRRAPCADPAADRDPLAARSDAGLVGRGVPRRRPCGDGRVQGRAAGRPVLATDLRRADLAAMSAPLQGLHR
jgi:hypothetical protein